MHEDLAVDLKVGRAQLGEGSDLGNVKVIQGPASIGRQGFAVQPPGNEMKRSEADEPIAGAPLRTETIEMKLSRTESKTPEEMHG
jgi:hypothetical protein